MSKGKRKRDPNTLRPRECPEPGEHAPDILLEPLQLKHNEKRELRQEESPGARYLYAARMRALKGTRESLRLQQQALQELLWAYARSEVDAIPKDAATAIALAFDEMLAGHPSALFTPPALGKGGTGSSPTVKEAKADAVRYIKYCEAGYILCLAKNGSPRHTKTVAENYGVERRTVQEWVDESVGITAPKTPDPDPESWEAQTATVADLMRISGRTYRSLSRAKKAKPGKTTD